MTEHPDQEPPDAESFLEKVRRRLNGIHHWMESTGLGSHALQFILLWWNKLGTAGASAVLLAVILPAGGYATLAHSTSRSIPGWIGDFGVEFEAADWDIHVLSLSATAHEVKIRRDVRSEPVLQAAEIEFDGSIWTVLSSLFGRGGAYNEISIRHAEVLVERELTGDFNWAEFLEAVPIERRRDAADGLYTINAIHIEDLRVIYLEHVPGGSGGGVIKTSQSRVYFEGVTGGIFDIKPPDRTADQPTSFALKARLADGVIEVKGRAGFFPEQLIGPSTQFVRVKAGPSASDAGYQVRLFLDNIGMGAFGQMVATTQIVPTSGSMRGNVEVQQASGGLTCRCDLVMENVAFAPNPHVVLDRARYDDVHRELASYRKSGPFDLCGEGEKSTRQPKATDGSMSAMLASFNSQCVDTAPRSIRTLVARDQNALGGVVAAGLYDEFIDSSTSGNAIGRGIKSVGRSIKHLFGGK